ncbi:MAG TPA: mechanosensitive ion channel family protein [Bryobacteraceae bacterium]|nr:mechanosensitive ion channel family protein [Bryobacteraceae bacterium]
MQIFGIRLVGVTAENGRKLLLTIVFLFAVWLVSRLLRSLAHWLVRGRTGKRVEFWTRQAIQLATAIIAIIGVLSIWFNDPNRQTTFLGLFSAGLAFALQRVVTAIAAYFVLLRGRTFNVGERIKMGGVRGDVIALGFIQTTIMEMGQPPAEQSEDPGMWVQARQYTGRVVTVTNDKIFDEPVYNYSRDFPFIWEEMRVGISYTADRARAEQILLEAARRNTESLMGLGEATLQEMERRYFLRRSELEPRVFWRLTDNWLELALRFLCREYDVRSLKDKMTREILRSFDDASIQVASGTYEVVGMPDLHVQIENPPGGGQARPDWHNRNSPTEYSAAPDK